MFQKAFIVKNITSLVISTLENLPKMDLVKNYISVSKYILPVPFNMGPYGNKPSLAYQKILQVSGSSENYANHFPDNLLIQNCEICQPVDFEVLPDDQKEEGVFLKSVVSMQKSVADQISKIWPTSQGLVVFGGDHSVAVGTGLGLSQVLDMSEVGLIWVDAHGDINTPQTSKSKSVTGYPVAVNLGYGPQDLIQPFNGNFVQKVVQIGIRDLDQEEAKLQRKYVLDSHSILDMEEKGMSLVVLETLKTLENCKYIWLSIDADSLDAVYFQKGETDLPVVGGLTPREILYLTYKVAQTGKLVVTEITQLNETAVQTPLDVLFSRVSELALGLGGFRYGK